MSCWPPHFYFLEQKGGGEEEAEPGSEAVSTACPLAPASGGNRQQGSEEPPGSPSVAWVRQRVG